MNTPFTGVPPLFSWPSVVPVTVTLIESLSIMNRSSNWLFTFGSRLTSESPSIMSLPGSESPFPIRITMSSIPSVNRSSNATRSSVAELWPAGMVKVPVSGVAIPLTSTSAPGLMVCPGKISYSNVVSDELTTSVIGPEFGDVVPGNARVTVN